jgi:2-polyprenyl-3-methyl-5-hydroxy-6-metoxy-1,4-benzoquinol methylase
MRQAMATTTTATGAAKKTAAALKQAVQIRLAKSGIAVVRTDKRKLAPQTYYSAAEVEQLDRDLQALNLNEKDFGMWTSAAAVRAYLRTERINMYHQMVSTISGLGVDLSNKSVLDVGTCSGYLLRIIGQRFAGTSLNGTDYYEECVKLSAALVPDAKVFQASIADLTDSAESYDVVFCTEVLEHIVDTEGQIPILLDRVKPGGALMVTVPNGTYDFTPFLTSKDGISYVGHVNFWSEPSWQHYVDRIAPSYRKATGTLGVHLEKDALYAVIFKD